MEKGESQMWKDFVEDCWDYGYTHPWDEGAGEIEVSYGFAAKWLDVAVGN